MNMIKDLKINMIKDFLDIWRMQYYSIGTQDYHENGWNCVLCTFKNGFRNQLFRL